MAASNAIPDETVYALAKGIVREAVLASQTNSAERAAHKAWQAARLLDVLSGSGDRALLPIFEEVSLSSHVRTREVAAQAYTSLATAEECAAFLPKIFAIGNDNITDGGWRNRATPACLAKIDAAIAKHELSDETVARFLTALLMFAQSTDNSWEAKNADDFLAKHCEGYPTSKQKLALWRNIVDNGNEYSKKQYTPLKESVEAVPPRKRIDLRERFPSLPSLPEDKADRSFRAITLAVGAALIAACAAILIALKRRRTRNHADGHPNNLR